MNKLFVLCLATVSLALAGTHRITIYQNSRLNGAELKAGEYKMELTGDKIVLQSGKVKVEAPAKIETSEAKYSTNSIRYKNDGDKFEILEIHVGGTKTKVVLN